MTERADRPRRGSIAETHFLLSAAHAENRYWLEGIIPDELRFRLPLTSSLDSTWRYANDEMKGYPRARFAELYADLREQGVLRPVNQAEAEALLEVRALGYEQRTPIGEMDVVDTVRLREAYPDFDSHPVLSRNPPPTSGR